MKKTRFFTFSSFLKQRENRPFRGFFNFWHMDQLRKLVDTTAKSALKLQVIRFIRAKIRYSFAKLPKIYRRLYRLSPLPPTTTTTTTVQLCVKCGGFEELYLRYFWTNRMQTWQSYLSIGALPGKLTDFPSLAMSKDEKTLEGLM